MLKLNQLLHRKKKGSIGRDLVSEICMARVKQLQNGEITGRLDTGGSKLEAVKLLMRYFTKDEL